MRVLVTGGGGFLGLALARALAARGDTVVAIDTAIGSGLAALAQAHPTVRAFAADVADMASLCRVMKTEPVDAVLHCAAVVGVVASLGSPNTVFRVNIEGCVNLFEAMSLFGVRRVIHISSEETYGHFRADVITEDHPAAPIYAYGISKVAVEHLGRTYRLTHGIECINLRTSWVYGPGFPRMRVPRDMVEAAIAGRALRIPCGADSAIDHTYVDDFVAGTLLALDHRDHRHDAYHIASGVAPTVAELAAIVNELVPGADITVGPGAYRHAGKVEVPRKGALDCSRARDAFGYQPAFGPRQGLAAYIASYRNRPGEQA